MILGLYIEQWLLEIKSDIFSRDRDLMYKGLSYQYNESHFKDKRPRELINVKVLSLTNVMFARDGMSLRSMNEGR